MIFPRFVAPGALLAFALSLAACDDGPPPHYPPPSQGSTQLGYEDEASVTDDDVSAIDDFREPLEPYGSWADDPVYGTIWVPSDTVVGDDFTPYVTAGHWVYDDDWIWVSDYSWGWAPFHYGRWVYVDGRRWCWIPGRRYSGAWVVWQSGGDRFGYVGWAPAPPDHVWRGGVAVRTGFVVPEPRYAFVARGEVFSPSLRERVVVGDQARVLEHDTASFGHAVRGPSPARLGIEPRAVVHSVGRPHYMHSAPHGGHGSHGGGHHDGHH
ncbi:MAG: DUF6600 domain-containing protein [Polyangiaceae bacterium]